MKLSWFQGLYLLMKKMILFWIQSQWNWITYNNFQRAMYNLLLKLIWEIIINFEFQIKKELNFEIDWIISYSSGHMCAIIPFFRKYWVNIFRWVLKYCVQVNTIKQVVKLVFKFMLKFRNLFFCDQKFRNYCIIRLKLTGWSCQ